MYYIEELHNYLDNLFNIEIYRDRFDFTLLNSSILNNGLVLQSSREIHTIIGSVFASDKVLYKIIEDYNRAVLWIVHHPFYIFDISKYGVLSEKQIYEMKSHNISLYVSHMPLDVHDNYGNAVCF